MKRSERKLSEATKQKIREKALLRWSDPDRRKLQSEKHTGKVVSPETRERMSRARTGMKYNTKKLRGISSSDGDFGVAVHPLKASDLLEGKR